MHPLSSIGPNAIVQEDNCNHADHDAGEHQAEARARHTKAEAQLETIVPVYEGLTFGGLRGHVPADARAAAKQRAGCDAKECRSHRLYAL